jgi:hypothetical protein
VPPAQLHPQQHPAAQCSLCPLSPPACNHVCALGSILVLTASGWEDTWDLARNPIDPFHHHPIGKGKNIGKYNLIGRMIRRRNNIRNKSQSWGLGMGSATVGWVAQDSPAPHPTWLRGTAIYFICCSSLYTYPQPIVANNVSIYDGL